MSEPLKTVRIKVKGRPTLEYMLKVNKEYIDCLRKTKGERAVEQYKRHLKQEVSKAPLEGSYIEVPVVEVS